MPEGHTAAESAESCPGAGPRRRRYRPLALAAAGGLVLASAGTGWAATRPGATGDPGAGQVARQATALLGGVSGGIPGLSAGVLAPAGSWPALAAALAGGDDPGAAAVSRAQARGEAAGPTGRPVAHPPPDSDGRPGSAAVAAHRTGIPGAAVPRSSPKGPLGVGTAGTAGTPGITGTAGADAGGPSPAAPRFRPVDPDGGRAAIGVGCTGALIDVVLGAAPPLSASCPIRVRTASCHPLLLVDVGGIHLAVGSVAVGLWWDRPPVPPERCAPAPPPAPTPPPAPVPPAPVPSARPPAAAPAPVAVPARPTPARPAPVPTVHRFVPPAASRVPSGMSTAAALLLILLPAAVAAVVAGARALTRSR